MELSGPSYCQIKDGYPCNKWLVTTHERTPKGTTYESYYFDTKDDAETYFLYLQQCIGIDDLLKKINNPRTFKWEKAEYEEFYNSLDLTTLENAVKNIKFEQEHHFYKALPTKEDKDEY